MPTATTDRAKCLIMHSVEPVLRSCGNSYANSYIQQWLEQAKEMGAYHGFTTGLIVELMDEWEEWLDSNGGLPEIGGCDSCC